MLYLCILLSRHHDCPAVHISMARLFGMFHLQASSHANSGPRRSSLIKSYTGRTSGICNTELNLKVQCTRDEPSSYFLHRHPQYPVPYCTKCETTSFPLRYSALCLRSQASNIVVRVCCVVRTAAPSREERVNRWQASIATCNHDHQLDSRSRSCAPLSPSTAAARRG